MADSNEIHEQIRIPVSLPVFDGHFPGQPILPAVATVDVCVQFMKEHLQRPSLHLRKIKNAKFVSPIQPGTTIDIVAKRELEDEWQIDLKEAGSGRQLASLWLVLR